MHKLLIALLAVLLVSTAVACNDDDGGTRAGGVTTDEALPDDFPVYDGSEFDAGGVTDDGDLSTFLGTWRTDASPEEVRRFFEDYKVLEQKQVVVEDLLGPFDALRLIREALVLYQQLRRGELKQA